MGTKIKIFFGLLAFGAIVSVLSLFDYFNAGFASNLKLNNIASKFSFATDTDYDEDGLINIDESYWNTDPYKPDTDGDGFKDGEEVASGHDPNKPGPDDSLKDINLTEKLAELTAAGLAEGSLKPENNKYYESLAIVTNYAEDNSLFALNRIVTLDPKKITDSTKTNQDEYLNQAYKSIEIFLKSYGEEIRNIDKKLDIIGAYGFGHKEVKEYFSKEEGIFREIYNKTSNLNVPKNWTNEHIELLGEMKIVAESNRSVILGSNDPIKAAMALNELFEALNRIPNWSQKYINKNRKEGINNQHIESLSK